MPWELSGAASGEKERTMTVEDIAERLIAQKKRVSVAEADTCGLIGYLLSTVPGSSQYFPGGVIAYTGGLKQKILGVSDELYQTKGTVSPEMAIAMARGVRDLTGTDYGLSVTGVAGPTGGRSGLPVGTFYVGLVGPDGVEVAERIHTDAGERDGNKRQAAQAALDLLGRHVS
jgi:nicotinamide-nucleotide amidase